jgi:hypothetical protein
MIPAGEIVSIHYLSWNTLTNEPEPNDAGNHAIAIVKDGVEIAASGTPVSLSAGENKITLTTSESDAKTLIVGGVSSTPNVVIIPVMILTNKITINQPLYIGYTAWDLINNVPKTGDVANHTLYLAQGGTEISPTNTPTEVNDLSLPGLYLLLTTAPENTDRSMALYGESSTPDINVLHQLYSPDPAVELVTRYELPQELILDDEEIIIYEGCQP